VVDNNQIIFIDFARGYKGDCFAFVMRLFTCTYWEALERINRDLRLNLGTPLGNEADVRWHFEMMQSEKQQLEKSERSNIVYKERLFENYDLAYWYAYGSDIHYLSVYGISPISDYWIDSWWQGVSKHAYGWETLNSERKIYQPFVSKSKKWRSNTSNDYLQGERQLPRLGSSLLLIQSSMKDISCVAKRYRIPSIAPNGEHGIIPKRKLEQFESRFSRICVLMDNDSEGIKAAQKYLDYNYEIIMLPQISKNAKDPSDFIFNGYHKQLDETFKIYKLIDT
jgi:hypothetical protein